jgi:hypothetical protein
MVLFVAAPLVIVRTAHGEFGASAYSPRAVPNQTDWQAATGTLPKEKYFPVQGAWLDDSHRHFAVVAARLPVELEEYHNAALAIIEVDGGHFRLRQFLDLLDSKRDYKRPERLSFPMHAARWSGPWNGWPRYSHAWFYTPDIDGDDISDLVITLWYSGGSYSGAETFVLRNQGGQYRIVLSRRGAEGGRIKFDRVADLDNDGKPEILVWDEVWGPGSHAEARDWVDIFHWSGGRMVRVNHLFPAVYAPVKAGMAEVCDRRPGETPEFYYYLGLISEYDRDLHEAQRYYKRSLSADRWTAPEERHRYAVMRSAYRRAAEQRLNTLEDGAGPNTASQPTPRKGAAER